MARPVTIFTGQWADLPFETLCQKIKSFGYDGLELACWGDHFDITDREIDFARGARENRGCGGLPCFSLSNTAVWPVLALCAKSCMKHHDPVGPVFPKWQSKKVLLGNPLQDQVRDISEAEPFVIVRGAYKHAALCASISQCG